jgi:SAM-dependent methyltransferase
MLESFTFSMTKEIVPVTSSLFLHNLQGSIAVDTQVTRPGRIFTLDIYSYLRQEHPETHLGWWGFPLPLGERKIQFRVDFRSISRDSVHLLIDGDRVPCSDFWTNPSYLFDPLQDLQLVLRNEKLEIEQLEHVVMKTDDPLILKQFYARLHATGGYGTSLPFLPTMHYYKLDVLKKLFTEYVPPGGNALDLGCGRCLFTDIQPNWPFRIFAGDLDVGLIRERKNEVPQNYWFVSDVLHAPFRSEYFDALFAGEIIEHVSDPAGVLQEWKRVLKPGGVIILTTPNRERLLAKIEGRERPYSPDHLRELSYNELRDEVLPAAGLKVLETRGIYLEVLLNWFGGNPKRDYLQAEWNQEKYVPLMKVMNRLGRVFPQYSLDMIFVCQKN